MRTMRADLMIDDDASTLLSFADCKIRVDESQREDAKKMMSCFEPGREALRGVME